MSYSDYIIYVDESGDHSLTSIDNDYPVFVLCFCIFKKDVYTTSIVPAVQAFKFRHFGHDSVILHEHEIRKQKPPFAFLQIRSKQEIFMNELSGLIEGAEFTIIAAAIDKIALKRQYANPARPYETALKFCMERAYKFLGEMGQGGKTTYIIVEQRGKREDEEIELEFRRICDGANMVGKMPEFEIVLASKKTNSAGLQLADLTARPIGRYVMAPTQANRAWTIIERKMRRDGSGNINGWGLKRFP